MMRIIYDIDNVTHTYDGDMVGRRWKMTPDGLACVDCDGLQDDDVTFGGANIDMDLKIQLELEDKQRALEAEKERLEREMEKRQQELQKINDKLEEDEELEEASGSPNEILLKRVINASYRVSPTLHRTVQITYPG